MKLKEVLKEKKCKSKLKEVLKEKQFKMKLKKLLKEKKFKRKLKKLLTKKQFKRKLKEVLGVVEVAEFAVKVQIFCKQCIWELKICGEFSA